MFKRVMHSPLKRPTPAAAKSATPIAATIGQPLDISEAAKTAVIAQTEPTERSMPPVKITKVIPMATIPTKEKLRVTLIRFSTCRNCGMETAMIKTMMINAARLPNSLTASNRLSIDSCAFGALAATV